MIYINIKSLINFKPDGWSPRDDLFIVLTYKEQIRRTTIKWNNKTPIWNEAFIFNDEGPDVIKLRLYDSNLFDKDIVLYEESVPIFLGKIQEFNVGKFKFDMGNPLVDTEKDQMISDIKKEIINNKNDSLNIILKLSEKLDKIQTIIHQ